MNWDSKRYGLMVGSAALMAAIHLPAQAAQTEITDVSLAPSGTGFELMLKTQGNNRPPVFTVNRGNASVSDLSNAQLRLPNGTTFSQPSPAPGIASIEMRQLDASTVRITVQGVQGAPVGETLRRDDQRGLLVLRFNPAGGLTNSSAVPNNTPSTGPAPNSTPPFTNRAVAPPVGDMAVGSVNAEPDAIDLGGGQIIPKLLLRNAPVREVLTLLGRAANVNVAFSEEDAAADPANPGAAAGSGSTISLDIENESVQDVFNYVVRLSGMQANKVGNTIFVGKTLPGDARNRIVRTLRLNQIRATGKVTFSNALIGTSQVGGSVSGAQASITSSGGDASASISGGSSGSASSSTLSRLSKYAEEFRERGAKEILESYGANGGGGGGQDQDAAASDLLKDLQVVADARINSVTLIGTPRKVELATSILRQLDIRKRQAAVNVKIIDIDLLKTKNIDGRIGFRDGAGFGVGVGNGPNDIGSALGLFFGGAASPVSVIGDATRVVGSLLANVGKGTTKVLSDPTLIVQEGSSAQVNLTEEVFSGFEQTSTQSATGSGGGIASVTIKPIIRQAGVIFNVTVDRVDDNGFVTLNVSPEVSAPLREYDFRFPGDESGSTLKGALLSQRRLETGKIRLRDGQTLILSGIIQDTDKTEVSKVPILGDIPLLGILFRRESGTKSRKELVVLVTPRLMDDSDQTATGYQYSPSPDAQNLLKK